MLAFFVLCVDTLPLLNALLNCMYLAVSWLQEYADTRDNIHIAVHIPGGGCVQRIFLKTDKLKVELALEYDEN